MTKNRHESTSSPASPLPTHSGHSRGFRQSVWIVLLLLVAVGWTGCSWIRLAIGSLTYPTTAFGEAANVVIASARAYVTLGERGLAVYDLATGAQRTVVAPPAGIGSIDDLAIDGHLLFTLDARRPGFLVAWSIEGDGSIVPIQPPIAVDCGPFSGVAAAGGRVVVSGGTGSLTLRSYDATGRIGTEVATADLGRGQPDVLLAPDGRTAFVSTHEVGPYFSMSFVALSDSPLAATKESRLALNSYGFTPGGYKPANFPIECALGGKLLLIAEAEGLDLVDIAQPSQPRRLRQVQLPMQAVAVDALDGVAAVVGSRPQPTLLLVDVSRPEIPRVVQDIALPSGAHPTGVALTPDRLVVAAQSGGTLIYDRTHGNWLP